MEGMSLLKYQKPKGTADILADESAKCQYVEAKARELFKKYRYHEMRTPTFQNFEVFSRHTGDKSKIVKK